MPRTDIIRKERFSATIDNQSNPRQRYVSATWSFQGRGRNPKECATLLVRLVNVLKKVFKDSGVMRMEAHPGEIHRLLDPVQLCNRIKDHSYDSFDISFRLTIPDDVYVYARLVFMADMRQMPSLFNQHVQLNPFQDTHAGSTFSDITTFFDKFVRSLDSALKNDNELNVY